MLKEKTVDKAKLQAPKSPSQAGLCHQIFLDKSSSSPHMKNRKSPPVCNLQRVFL